MCIFAKHSNVSHRRYMGIQHIATWDGIHRYIETHQCTNQRCRDVACSSVGKTDERGSKRACAISCAHTKEKGK